MLGIAALDAILDPSSNDEVILGGLAALQLDHINREIISEALQKIRQTADIHADLQVDLHEIGRFSIDCSGTGGSGIAHFNASTSTAFVLAAAGFKVAKFGGRAASGKSGSFDFLELLGIHSRLPIQKCEDAMSICGLAFIFAPTIYPSLRRLAPLRKQFGKPTLLNYLGPLLNPLRPASRLMGISSDHARKLVAAYLLEDEMAKRTMLVTAGGRFDEFAINALNEISLIEDGQLQEFQLDACTIPRLEHQSGHGVAVHIEQDLHPQANFKIFNNIIEGHDVSSPHYKMLLLNAAGALYVLKACASLSDGVAIAADLIEGGAVAESVSTCRRFYEKLSC